MSEKQITEPRILVKPYVIMAILVTLAIAGVLWYLGDDVRILFDTSSIKSMVPLGGKVK